MIPELGHFALILSALVALALGTLPLLGAHRQRADWIAIAQPATSAFALLVTFAFACLPWAFVFVTSSSLKARPVLWQLWCARWLAWERQRWLVGRWVFPRPLLPS